MMRSGFQHRRLANRVSGRCANEHRLSSTATLRGLANVGLLADFDAVQSNRCAFPGGTNGANNSERSESIYKGLRPLFSVPSRFSVRDNINL